MKSIQVLQIIIINIFLSIGCSALHRSPDATVVKLVSIKYVSEKYLHYEFNGGRPFVISLNNNVNQAEQVKARLFICLAERGLLKKVVFNLFSSEDQPSFIEIKFGNKVEIGIVQSIISAFIEVPNIKLTFTIANKDGSFGNNQRVYVASRLQIQKQFIKIESLRLALNPEISQNKFYNLLLVDN